LSLSFQSLRGLAAEIKPRTQAFIAGGFLDAATGETFDTINPATGQVITRVAACGLQDVESAVVAARHAFEDGRWRRRSSRERKHVLLNLADLIEQHLDELALLETLDIGKPISNTRSLDIPKTANMFRWYAEAIDKRYDEVAPTGNDALAFITREPLGVIGTIVPWNFPLYVAAYTLAPALAMGNSVVLKPAEQSPLTAIRLGELAAKAGIPDGVLNVLPAQGIAVGQAIGKHLDVDCVSFTGSTKVGKQFLLYAAESNAKRVNLELGGKSPNIVLADAPDLEIAASAAAWGIFYAQGQVCSAGSRLLVDRRIQEKFVEKVINTARSMRLGDPLDPDTQLGALVSQAHLERVMRYVDSGKRAGAKLALGGNRVLETSGGYFLEPTIFTGVDNSMQIAQEEIFGPVLSVITFDEVDEAIRIANDSMHGLGAAVWTRDVNTAFRVARALRVGSVWINNYDDSDLTVPWGGVKGSGNGRAKSLHALEEYSVLKSTWIKLS